MKANNLNCNKSMFNPLILLIIFNRPDAIQKVSDRLREIKPQFLSVPADSKRFNEIYLAQSGWFNQKVMNYFKQLILEGRNYIYE